MPVGSNDARPLSDLVDAGVPILGEAATGTRLRLESPLPIDGELGLVSAVEDPVGVAAIQAIAASYVAIASAFGLPILVDAPTWWARVDRLERAGRDPSELDAVVARCLETVSPLREQYADVYLGAVIGPSVDGYRAEPVDARVAATYHGRHVEALTSDPLDLITAATFSTADDLAAAAVVLAATEVPYVLGPVVEATGHLPDGTPLGVAIERIEAEVARPPLHWAICCTHPRTAGAALERTRDTHPRAHDRVRQIKGNGSDRATDERDGSDTIMSDHPESWAEAAIALHDEHGVSIVGGCCGTDDRHLLSLAIRLAQRSGDPTPR